MEVLTFPDACVIFARINTDAQMYGQMFMKLPYSAAVLAVFFFAVWQGFGALIAFDDFESYTAGAQLEDGVGTGLNGGTGWNSDWEVKDSQRAAVTIAAAPLSYYAGEVGLSGGANVLRYTAIENNGVHQLASREFAPVQSGTLYLSFLYCELSNGDDDFLQLGFDDAALANPVAAALDRNGNFQARSGTTDGADTGITSVTGEVYFIVLKISKTGGTYDRVSVFVNPTTATEGAPDATDTRNSTLASAFHFALRTAFYEIGDIADVDEIRVGTTWADVVPTNNLVAHEDFESYTVGEQLESGAGLGLNGGSNWAAGWDVNDSRRGIVTVKNYGLNYSGGAVRVLGGDRSMQIISDGGSNEILLSRGLSASQTGTVYMSFLYRNTVDTGGNDDFLQAGLHTSANAPGVSAIDRNVFQARLAASATSSGTTSSTNETFLVVMKAEKTGGFGANYDQVSVFINPTTLTEPGAATVVATGTNSGISSSPLFVLRRALLEVGDTFLIDEVRVGSSYSDVVVADTEISAAGQIKEDFESYAAGIQVEGLSGGTGWSGDWNARDSISADLTVVAANLSYANGSVVSNGGNRALQFTPTASSTASILARPFPSQSGTIYMSLLYQQSGGNDGGDDFIQIGMANVSLATPRVSVLDRNGSFEARSTTSSTNSVGSGTNSALSTTYMLVMKIEKSGSTYDQVHLFVNPSSTSEPAPDATSAVNSGLDLAGCAVLLVREAFLENGSDSFLFDEFIIGDSWADVVTGSNVPPVAVADSSTVSEDGPAFTIDFLGNDTDDGVLYLNSIDTGGLLGSLNTVNGAVTTLPVSADSYIQENSAGTNFGTQGTLNSKSTSGAFRRKPYMLFDLSGLTFEQRTELGAATLNLVFFDGGVGTGGTGDNWDFEVYALSDAIPSTDGWGETTINWSNAPGNASGNDFDGAETTLLGGFTLAGVVGNVAFSSAGLTDFIANSSDDILTLMIKRVTTGDGGDLAANRVHNIRSKESGQGPTLDLTPISYSYDPNGQFDALLTGQTVTDSFSYIISDGAGTSVGTVVVTIQGADDDLNYTSTGGADDNLTLRINGANTEIVPTGGGAALGTQLTAITSSIVINGSAGDNTLTIDYSNGNPIPAGGITFTGGADSGGGDGLIITGTGSAFTSVTYRADGLDSGLITMVGGPGPGTITYSGLEPIIDNGDAVNRIFTLNTVSATITLTSVSPTQSNIDGSFENITFTNPTGSLTINGNTGNETFNITSVSAGLTVPVALNGLAGNDTFNFTAGGIDPANFTVDGGSESTADILNFDAQGGAAVDTGSSVTGPFNTVNYSDIETFNFVVVAVPTLGEWGIILLSILLLTMGLHHLVLIPAPLVANSAVANSALPQTTNGWIYSPCEFRKALLGLSALAVFGYACSLAFTGMVTGADAIGGLITVPVAAYFLHLVQLVRKQEQA
jgi:hypothetical protein